MSHCILGNITGSLSRALPITDLVFLGSQGIFSRIPAFFNSDCRFSKVTPVQHGHPVVFINTDDPVHTTQVYYSRSSTEGTVSPRK